MCIKSSCTNCHSKSHCQEKELRDEIEEYKKLTNKLIKELEDSNKLLELAGEKIEKMKNKDNCLNSHYGTTDFGCDYICHEGKTCPCENWELK